ncbi:hypothetical protein HPB47_015026 [Ixodes persulcatus]|uniref:Uncharacterized protein n=1 Tax=Ixodes persulcatus TaxID=34615 RepID=A0AC60QUI5_IXOPE|nr:hypothetical protein HPB47_015026 [Ixodes persulcatus]
MSWRSKKRILRAYREGATRRIQELRGACDRLWIQLLGEDYKLHRDFQHWENIRKAQFHRLCCFKRTNQGDLVYYRCRIFRRRRTMH